MQATGYLAICFYYFLYTKTQTHRSTSLSTQQRFCLILSHHNSHYCCTYVRTNCLYLSTYTISPTKHPFLYCTTALDGYHLHLIFSNCCYNRNCQLLALSNDSKSIEGNMNKRELGRTNSTSNKPREFDAFRI